MRKSSFSRKVTNRYTGNIFAPTKREINHRIDAMDENKLYAGKPEDIKRLIATLTDPIVLRKFIGRLISRTKSVAKRKGLDFNIDANMVLELYITQGGKCNYSGLEMSFISGNGKGNPNSYIMTIDRIDNNRGYTKDNIQLLCWRANREKSADSSDTNENYSRSRALTWFKLHPEDIPTMRGRRTRRAA